MDAAIPADVPEREIPTAPTPIIVVVNERKNNGDSNSVAKPSTESDQAQSYLAKREQPVWRQRLQRAYNRPEYDEALAALQSLQHELEDRNQSAAGSLAEGLDETLTLHRLGVYGVLGRSLKTTNGLESINALIEERCAKVDHWQNSSQRQHWLATALLDIEPRLRKVMGYRHLPRLRDALKRELKIDTTTSKTKAA